MIWLIAGAKLRLPSKNNNHLLGLRLFLSVGRNKVPVQVGGWSGRVGYLATHLNRYKTKKSSSVWSRSLLIILSLLSRAFLSRRFGCGLRCGWFCWYRLSRFWSFQKIFGPLVVRVNCQHPRSVILCFCIILSGYCISC